MSLMSYYMLLIVGLSIEAMIIITTSALHLFSSIFCVNPSYYLHGTLFDIVMQ